MDSINNQENILKLKDIHKGGRCFVIGTGPSLNKTDFSLLKNEILFGVNSLYLGHDKFGVSPQYYAVSDRGGWNKLYKELLQLNTILFLWDFVNTSLIPKNREDIIIIHRLGMMTNENQFSFDITKGSNWGHTVIIDLCLQVCYYMGFSEIYLLGCDWDFSAKDTHFYEGNFGIPPNFYSVSEAAYLICKQVYEKNGRKLINCTPNSKLKMLPKKTLEEIFK